MCENEELLEGIEKSRSPKKPPFSAVCMLVSCFFCRSVATSLQTAVVSFAENGRLSGLIKDVLMIFGSYYHKKAAFY
jgi:hypothetical protein